MTQDQGSKEEKEERLYRIRHSSAHIMAQAVQQLFGEVSEVSEVSAVKLAIGPPVENEFYYDMELPRALTPEDLPQIESRMRAIINAGYSFIHETWSVDKAKAWFSQKGQKFKVELIEGLVASESEGVSESGVSIYHQGDFTDLCKGQHVKSTGECQHFKLLRVSGAYWRGDEKREQLQRIYGTAWETAEELNAYLKMLEEAERRDHRKLGKELELFQTHPEAPGSVFWLPKGTIVYNLLSQKVRRYYLKNGYQEVKTPLIYDKSLWETSGHWDHYRDKMFLVSDDAESSTQPTRGLKPMNCPAHMLIYRSKLRSYRELPLRIYDQGVLHRNETSGAIGGLTRVYQFCQDDAHNFVRKDQIEDEIGNILQMVERIYTVLGLGYSFALSTRNPENYMGDIQLWSQAEASLERVLKNRGFEYKIAPDEAAFYGPKIDIFVKDSMNRAHQTATIQLDFQIPERFELNYIDSDNTQKRPVVIHRAIYGSFERLIAILIEHFAGAFPVWLAPIQCKVLSISQKHVAYAQKVKDTLLEKEIRVELDDRDDKIGAKIRDAQLQKIPYMLIVGAKEEANNSVSVRSRENGDLGPIALEKFSQQLCEESNVEF